VGTDTDYRNSGTKVKMHPESISAQAIVTGGVQTTVTVQPTPAATQPVSIRQPSLGLNYIICVQGIYPPRS
jgi:microcystin-dependent protein